MISILCPSRGRPEKARKMYLSALRTAVEKPKIMFYVDEDDPRLDDYKKFITGIQGPCLRAGMAHQILCEKSEGIRLMMGDDVRFVTPGWDRKIEEVAAHYPDGIFVITTEDGIEKIKNGERKQPCAHPAIGPGWFDALGYTAPPIFQHFMPDVWVTEVAKMIGRHVHLGDVTLFHKRISLSTGRLEADRTYLHIRDMQPGDTFNPVNRKDRMVYDRLQSWREYDAQKLKERIDAYRG